MGAPLQSAREVPIDLDIYEYLKSRSTFEDTVSTVLRRELKLPSPAEDSGPTATKSLTVASAGGDKPATSQQASRQATRQRPKRRRAAAGTLLPESEYMRPILEVIAQAGGQAPKQLIMEEVGERLGDRLTEADREELDSGGIRWQSRIQFARLRLVDRGLIDKTASRGVWALTSEGIKALEEGVVRWLLRV